MATRNIPKPPERVREGQIVSARWMNRVVECLDALVKESGGVAGSGARSSSSIDSKGLIRNTKFRAPEEVELPVYCKDDFKLRIKPKQFCEVDKEGNWDKVLQVREGHIIDYRGMDQLVPMSEEDGSGEEEDEEEEQQQQEDADGKEDAEDEGGEDAEGGGKPQLECGADWHDMGTIGSMPVTVYCIIKQDCHGEVTEAYFSNVSEGYKPWGFKTKAEAEAYEKAKAEAEAEGRSEIDTHGDNHISDGSGIVSVLIGQAHCEVVNDEGEKHYYIEQNHSGRIELQVVEVQPFTPILSDGSADALYGGDGGSVEPLCLFLERDVNLFIFKGLYNKDGITLTDGADIGIGLEYANDGMTAKSDANAAATGDYQLGGVTSIKYNSINSAPHVRFGVIDVPTADTVDRHATGVVNGVSVEYVEEGESANSYIEDGHIHVVIKKFGAVDDSLHWGSGTRDGSVPGWGSGGSDGSSGQGECGCAAKWQALEAWKASIEARLTALENGGGGGGCNCQCLAAGLMDEIQAAIDEAVSNVRVEASLSQVLEVTQTGTLHLDGRVSADSSSGNSSVDAHY